MRNSKQAATLTAKTKEFKLLTKKEEEALLKAQNGIESKINTFISSNNNSKTPKSDTAQLGNGWILKMVYDNYTGEWFTAVIVFHNSWGYLKIGEKVGETYNIRELSKIFASYVVTYSKPTVAKRLETELDHGNNRIMSKTIRIKGLF